MIKWNKTKPYTISKQIVYEAYKRVKASKGAQGDDRKRMNKFDENLKGNLYKLWNRISLGSYFPPLQEVEIPKVYGGTRKLGIPTIADRIAQMVVKIYLEPKVEPHFIEDSYGFRPNKSALQAVGKTRVRCWKYDWVVDIDIKGFFDNLDHELLMKAVRKHTNSRWIQLYMKRWREAPIPKADGEVISREKGTPQGGVVSPLLANLFLHYAFDKWMLQNHRNSLFERYADDIVIDCKTASEAEAVMHSVEERLG